MALTARLIMVFAFNLVQIEMYLRQIGNFHTTVVYQITRSHPQVSFSKALTSHVRHHYKERGQFLYFSSEFFLEESFLRESKATINGRILRLTRNAK